MGVKKMADRIPSNARTRVGQPNFRQPADALQFSG
jgi:hypothetical protein